MIENIIFYAISSVTVAATLSVVFARKSVYAIMGMVLAFFSAATLWVLLNAEFLAMILVVVYVGAVMVLFLFVVMMTDADTVHHKSSKFFSVILAIPSFAFLLELIIVTSKTNYKVIDGGAAFDVKAIGAALFGEYIYATEVAAVILLVAIIAAIALPDIKPAEKLEDDFEPELANKDNRLRLVKMDTPDKEQNLEESAQ
ncbi:MAG: NADH-quinone oxidoreductase subunit J [Gammaproteobacteria bacterium]|nr:MAG: NADH-quinone oxidoreductase subunit J [Gammaproteobacteria bacterium]